MPLPDRTAVIASLITRLQQELDGVEAMARLASAEATGEESRAENQYDTRSLEASYLARGQAERVGALRGAVGAARALSREPGPPQGPAGVGALLSLRDGDDQLRHVLLVAQGGGTSLEVAGARILVVTPDSPLGGALLGARLDDDLEVHTARGEVSYSVEHIG